MVSAPLLGRLHHVGIAVASIEAVLPAYRASLSCHAITSIIHDPVQKARVLFLRTHPEEHTLLELVEPAGEDPPLRRFLDKTGGGWHHLCYEVQDIAAALKQVRGRKAVIISRPKAAVAFGGRQIAWIIVERLLIELLEEEPG